MSETSQNKLNDNQIIEEQPTDIMTKLINIMIITIFTYLMCYLFIPSIRTDYFESMLIILMVVSVYVIYSMYL